MNPTPTPDPLGRKIDGRAALTQALEKLDSPTPNSPAPVDIARLRELLEKATPGPWSVRKAYFDRNKRSVDADYEIFPHTDGRKKPKGCGEWTELCECKSYDEKNKKNADLIAALRNEAPALLNELESRREESEWIEQIETLLFIATPDEKGLPAPLDDLSLRIRMVIAERDKLREEVEKLRGLKDVFKQSYEDERAYIAGLEQDLDTGKTGEPLHELIDSLRQQNEQLLKEIEELKSRPTGLWKENY